jgi:hypothetical protein
MSGDIYHKVDNISARVSSIANYLGFVDDYVNNKDFLNEIPRQYFKIQYQIYDKHITQTHIDEKINIVFNFRTEFLPTFALWHWKINKLSNGNEQMTLTILIRTDKSISLKQIKDYVPGTPFINVIDDSIFQIVNYIKYYGIAEKIEIPLATEGAEIWKVGGDDAYPCSKTMNSDAFLSSVNYNGDQRLQKYFEGLITSKEWFKLFDIKFY